MVTPQNIRSLAFECFNIALVIMIIITRAMLQHSKASERMYNYVIIDFYDVMNDNNDGNNKKTKLGGGVRT